ncbi:TraB/GumN family protein [Bacteroides sp.]
MKKILSICLGLCLVATCANAQILWKVSGNGLEKPSYIMGTHHLAPLSIKDSIAGLQPAFDSATQVVGELNMAEIQTPAVMQTMQQMMVTKTDTTLQSLFTPEEYDMISKCAKENLMFDIAMMPKLKPAFLQNNLLVVLYMKHVGGFNPMEQMDTYFQTQATAKGKKVIPLETAEFQFNLLYNSTSLKRQAVSLLCMLNRLDKYIGQNKQMTALYLAQDLDGLFKLSEEQEGDQCDPQPGEMEAMLDNRNKTWAEKLPAILKAQPTFVAVGALHLPGENGLLNLLKKQGYTVEAVR